MFLELAENNRAYTPPSVYMASPGVLTRVRGYRRRGNRVPSHLRRLSEGEDNPYVFVPDMSGDTKGVMVREDAFDHLSDAEWKTLMFNLLPHQPDIEAGTMSEGEFLLSKKADRQKRREERRLRKSRKKESRTARKEARAKKKELKNKERESRTERRRLRQESKAEARRMRAEAKKMKYGDGGGSEEESEERTQIMSTVGDTLSNIFGKKDSDEGGSEDFDMDNGGDGGGDSEAGFQLPFGLKPMTALIGAAVIGGGIYFATRGGKKRRR